MSLYAISDLHLALSGDKPMDIFGQNWYMHDEKIKENWLKKIEKEDIVLIAGDISWSINLEDSLKELNWIHQLPGTKIVVKGNHDYWWVSISKLNNLFDDMKFLQNNFYSYGEYAVCGTRGWNCPGGDNFTSHDEKIYRREAIRLKLSLDTAKKSGFKKYIVMLHYPPTNDKFEDSDFTNIFKTYGVEKVIYGHLHGYSLKKALVGMRDGTEYINTSADYIKFDPLKII
ncbi:MAG: metallophosphoesterase [Bacillota bacterium]|nr:metallophosphoesterase [Bacillota bacterium]